MLTREKVEHVLRAAAGILDAERLVVVGSATPLLAAKRWPAEMALSVEVDFYVDGGADPDADGTLIAGTIGHESPFYRTFGYHGDGVAPQTAILPEGWRHRASEVGLTTAPGVVAIVPDLDDVAVSKLLAWRAKDQRWLEAGTRAGLLHPAVMTERLAMLPERVDLPPRAELDRRADVLAALTGG